MNHIHTTIQAVEMQHFKQLSEPVTCEELVIDHPPYAWWQQALVYLGIAVFSVGLWYGMVWLAIRAAKIEGL